MADRQTETPFIERDAIVVERPAKGVGLLRIASQPLGVLRMSVKRAMSERLAALEADPGMRVVIITGSGRAFSVGSDIRDFERDAGWLLAAEHEEQSLNDQIERARFAVIAACNGHCHGGGLVRPSAWLLEPGDVAWLDQSGEADGVRSRPAAIGIDRKRIVRAHRVAGDANPVRILFRRQAANLELARSDAGFFVEQHFGGDIGVRLAVDVVAADRQQRNLVRISAEQFVDRAAGRLADHVPDCAIDAGDRLEQQLAITIWNGAFEHRLPRAFVGEHALADNEGGELGFNQADDLETVRPVVAVIDVALDAFSGAQARDHCRAFQHVICTAAEVALERNVDCDGFDAFNPHVASLSDLS